MVLQLGGISDLWSSDHTVIARTLLQMYAGEQRTEGDIVTLSKAILPAYQAAVRSGSPLFVDSTDKTIQAQTDKVFRKVQSSTGVDPVFLYRYLSALEYAGKAGWIPYAQYNPATATIAAKESKAAAGETGSSWWDPLTSAITGQVRTVLIVGAVGLVGYGLLRTMILKPRYA